MAGTSESAGGDIQSKIARREEEEETMLARPVAFPVISNAILKKRQGPVYAIVQHKGLPIRVVKPYVYSFQLKYKQPPKGQVWTVRDFYCKELGLEPGSRLEPKYETYLKTATETGLVQVNNSPCDVNYVLKPGDVLNRVWHRHEVPVVHVPASEIILKETPDYIVVNKPSTVPFHPGGDYRLNSLTRILEEESPAIAATGLFPIHRLDRLTSGLLLIARSSKSAVNLAEFIQGKRNKSMRKTYLAKVKGKFPTEETGLKALPGFVKMEGQWVVISIPISDTFPRTEINEKSKESISRFRCLEYNEKEDMSLIKCEPVTGRTHQLRIHLLSVGFPIANDPDYGQWEKPKFAPPPYDEDFHRNCLAAIDELKRTPPKPANEEEEEGPVEIRYTFNHDGAELVKKQQEEISDAELNQIESMAESICTECSAPLLPPFHFGIYLHSYRVRLYLSGNLVDDFRGIMPTWAAPVDSQSGFWDD